MKSRNPRWLATRDQCVDFECVFAAYQGYLLEEPLRRSLWSALETTPEIGGSHEGCVWRVILPDMTVRFEFARQEGAGCQQDRPMAITYRGTSRAALAAASSTLPACRGQGSRGPTAVTTVSVREMIATIDCLAKELRSAPKGPSLSSDAGEFMPSGWQAVARRGRAGGRVSSLTAYYGYALRGRSSRTIEIFLVPGGLGRIVDTYAGIDNSGDPIRRTTTVDSVYVWRDSIVSRKRVRAEAELSGEGGCVGERWSAEISDFDISSLRFVRTVSRLVAQRDKRELEALVGDESM